jgi:hypothetical protein
MYGLNPKYKNIISIFIPIIKPCTNKGDELSVKQRIAIKVF